MSRFQIGVMKEPWVDMEPPISTEPLRESIPMEKEKVSEVTTEKVIEVTT